MKKRNIVLHGPLGGVVRSSAFQTQPPYTMVDGLNFWPIDVRDSSGHRERERMSRRPKLHEFGSFSGQIWALSTTYGIDSASSIHGSAILALAGTSVKLLKPTENATVTTLGTHAAVTRPIQIGQWGKYWFSSKGKKFGSYTTSSAKGWDRSNTPAEFLPSPAPAVEMIPADFDLTVGWADRMVVAGRPEFGSDLANKPWETPYMVCMSKAGNPWDYVYASPTSETAIYFQADCRPIALVPYSRQCLVIAGADKMMMVRGDPAFGGSIDELTSNIGMCGTYAWTRGPDDSLFFWTSDGMFTMPPGCGTQVMQIWRDKTPSELIGLSPNTHFVTLAYDTRFNCFHLTATPLLSVDTELSWTIFLKTGGFFKNDMVNEEVAIASISAPGFSSNIYGGAMLGGSSGTYRYDASLAGSIGTSLPYYTIGPFKLSSTPFEKSLITKMTARWSSDTDDTEAKIRIYTGVDGETVYEKYLAHKLANYPAEADYYCATVNNLRNNHAVYPRIGGHAALIAVTMSDSEKFLASEEITLETMSTGKARP